MKPFLQNILLFIAISCFVFSGCSLSNSTAPEEETGNVVFSFKAATFPAQVYKVDITLSRSGHPSIVKSIIARQDTVITIDSLAHGPWRIQAEAFNDSDVLMYSGASVVDVVPHQTISATIEMQPTQGSIELSIVWGAHPHHVISYDFNDGSPPAWGGSASVQNVNNELQISAQGGIQIAWEKFSSPTATPFLRGVLEVDIRPGTESYSVGLIGHTSTSSVSWGPYVVLRHGKVHYLQPNDQLIETETTFTADTWYRLRIIFDNTAGPSGRYKVYFKKLQTPSDDIFVGEFDYLADNGPLVDLVQYTFVGNPLDQPSTQFHIDNLYLALE